MKSEVLKTMRAMAWQRAKGELGSILETYWGLEEGFERASKEIKDFIKAVEDNGIVE